MPKARLIKLISNRYTLLTPDDQHLIAMASGKLKLGASPVVGDELDYELREDQVVITKIHPRKNQMKRPVIANVDQALIVMSAVKPDFSTQLVDRFTWLVRNADIEAVLVVTKLDLVEANHPVFSAMDRYERDGMKVVRVYKHQSLEALAAVIQDKISVLTGQSGVGKSTLLNRLNPEFVLRTQEISKALGRGKHTTRHVELFEVAKGWVADTPGFSSLEFTSIQKSHLEQLVHEFAPYRNDCFFRDCTHENEPKCAVKTALKEGLIDKERYDHYLEIRALLSDQKERKS